jgi:hypothetical protein
VLWKDHRTLAAVLRDQGLVDCLVARYCMNKDDEFTEFHAGANLAHLVVAKAQQSVEKVTKGWLLWQSSSFDPTKGHAPFTHELESQAESKERQRLLIALNRLNARLVKDLKWLESLAPRPPIVSVGHGRLPQPLTIIAENTEYPFWSPTAKRLVTCAEGLSMREHGSRAIKAVRVFLEAMTHSDPREFTEAIRLFLERYRISTSGPGG